MTPRERIKTSLNHREPDRIPIGYYATPEAHQKLKNALSINDDEKLLKRLGSDYRKIFPAYIGPKDMNGITGIDIPGKDCWGVVRNYVKNKFGSYLEIVNYPLKNIKTLEELEKIPSPKLEWFDFDSIPIQIEKFETIDEYWIIAYAGSVFEYTWYQRGLVDFMLDWVLNPELATSMMERTFNFYFSLAIETLKAGKGRIDMIATGDDIGGQNGMLISLESWRKMIKPWYKKWFKSFKDFGVKTLYHSCGGIEPAINDLIEIGLDVLNPLQFNAKNFPGKIELKTKYGKKLSFNGGMDAQRILPFGTVEDVVSETKNLIKILGNSGGYIIESCHAIQPDVKPENIMAMYDTAINYRYQGIY